MSAGKNKIILDFEFNPIADKELRNIAQHEIIEIGAVKLDENNRMLSKYQAYIKPQHNTITHKVTELTGITDKKLENAVNFAEGLALFREWIGNEKVSFYAWSDSDRCVLISEIALKLGEDSDDMYYFDRHWIDLQSIYQRIMGFQKSMGLTNALGTLMICFKGKEHGALADAINTAEIMKTLLDSERINKLKYQSAVTYNGNTHSTGGFSMGSVFAEQFAKLGT
ncbi:MAG: exonuclease domain-containing protein [Oscillospiraceae bacterium]